MALEERSEQEPEEGELLPDGPLQLVISFVPEARRGNLRLVSRKFRAMEAASRTRLVFRVPRVLGRSLSTLSNSNTLDFELAEQVRPASPCRSSSNVCSKEVAIQELPGVTGNAMPSVRDTSGRKTSQAQHGNLASQSDSETIHHGPVDPPATPGCEDALVVEPVSSFDAEGKHPCALQAKPSFPLCFFNSTTGEVPPGGASKLLGSSSVEDKEDCSSGTQVVSPKVELCNSRGCGEKRTLGIVQATQISGSGVGHKFSEGYEEKLLLPCPRIEQQTAQQGDVSDNESCQAFSPHATKKRRFFLSASDGELSEDDTCLDATARIPVPGRPTSFRSLGLRQGSLHRRDGSMERSSCNSPMGPSLSPAPSLSSLASPARLLSPLPTSEGSPGDTPEIPSPTLFQLSATASVVQTTPASSPGKQPLPPALALVERSVQEQLPRQDDPTSPDQLLAVLLLRFPNLKSLDIYDLRPGESDVGMSLDEKILNVVGQHAKCLEELHISGQTLGCTVSNSGLVAVARGCPRLRKLVVHHWVVGREGMAAFAGENRLQELEMDFFARDQATGPHKAVAEVARCHSLTSVHLRYCNSEDLRAIAQGCPMLTRLTLLFSVLGTSFGVLGRQCRSLQELTLRSCDASPFDDPLACLAEHCTSLQSLSLHAGHAATEPGLLKLVSTCRGLTKLSLEFNPVQSPFRLQNLAQHLAGLKELTLQWVQADDSDLIALSHYCTRLNILVLSLIQNVTDVGVTALLSGCGASLEVLLLRVRDASDAVLEVLGNKCQRLQRLTLALPQMSSGGFARMLQPKLDGKGRLPHLRRLRIWDCLSLEDEALDCVASFCPKLEGFGLKGCHGVSPLKLSALVQSCMDLDHLEVERWLVTESLQGQARTRGILLMDAVS